MTACGGRRRQTAAGLEATKVLPNSPGERAGIQLHDLLTGVNDVPVHRLSDLERELYRTGVYTKADTRSHATAFKLDEPVVVIPEPPDRSVQQALRLIGLIYLAIGMYVLFRRWTAPRATHFYSFCLVSFALYALKYTGKWDATRQDLSSGAMCWPKSLQPALFLHFALSFPEERLADTCGGGCCCRWSMRPGVACLSLWVWPSIAGQATGLLMHRLDQAGTGYDGRFYVLASLLFLSSYLRANTPLQRQQLKWLTRGTLLAVLPFTLLYAIPFLLRPAHAEHAHQACGTVAGVSAADVCVGHCALPADGYGPDLQAGRGVYAGHGADPGGVLRNRRA